MRQRAVRRPAAGSQNLSDREQPPQRPFDRYGGRSSRSYSPLSAATVRDGWQDLFHMVVESAPDSRSSHAVQGSIFRTVRERHRLRRWLRRPFIFQSLFSETVWRYAERRQGSCVELKTGPAAGVVTDRQFQREPLPYCPQASVAALKASHRARAKMHFGSANARPHAGNSVVRLRPLRCRFRPSFMPRSALRCDSAGPLTGVVIVKCRASSMWTESALTGAVF